MGTHAPFSDKGLSTPVKLDEAIVPPCVTFCVNVAATDLAAFIVTVQVAPEAVSHPLHDVKVELPAGVAASVTTVPELYATTQVVPQPICVEFVGFEVDVTMPLPVPDFETVKLNWVGGITCTVKLLALVAVPPGVATLNGPVVAFEGTVA
jgi:hypothetical protein